ncbi:MAG TPA: hypothetical protein VLS89_03275, partial [Candidatus Nanopelagicales bacterium]|nr:hypothetical protein [Candidatus Nanopelagicales bacterium]
MSSDERGEAARLRAMLDIIAGAQAGFMFEDNRRAVFEALLRGLLAATGSEYGFIGEVHRASEGQPFLKTHAITNIAWDEA